jgi:hypothetical protein
MSTLTPEESLVRLKKSLESKEKYKPQEHGDFLLYRFLRARKYDLIKTEQMFLDYLQWRETQKVDDIVNSFAFTESKQVSKYYPQYYHKTDKTGRTVYIEQLKNLDVTALLGVTTSERLMSRHIREYEKFTRYRLVACSLKSNKNIENGLTILDLKGVPLSQFNQVRKLIQSLTVISSNYYPETLGTMIVNHRENVCYKCTYTFYCDLDCH